MQLEVPRHDRSLRLSHRAAMHLGRRTGITDRFLRRVSPEVAATALTAGLQASPVGEDDVVIRADRHETALHVVSPTYAEAWDADIVEHIARPLAAAGWIVPPYRGRAHPRARRAQAHEVLPKYEGHWGTVEEGEFIQPNGARSIDLDMYLFLVHPERVVDTTDIMGRKVFRGVTISHSETGDCATTTIRTPWRQLQFPIRRGSCRRWLAKPKRPSSP